MSWVVLMATGAKMLITSLIEERLCKLGISMSPVAQEKSAPDVMFVVRRYAHCNEKLATVLAHSSVLKRECDFFREWFVEYERLQEKEDQQRQVVSQIVRDIMVRARQEGETRETVGKMVSRIMHDVVHRDQPDLKPAEAVVHDEGAAEGGSQQGQVAEEETKKVEDDRDEVPKYVVIPMLNWTLMVMLAILEWIYTRACHINLSDLASVYDAAEKMLFSSLTGAIRDYDSVVYLRHAIDGGQAERGSLLRLARRGSELGGLGALCQAMSSTAAGPLFSVVLDTSAVPYRSSSFLPVGVYMLDGHPVCCIREARGPAQPLRQYITLVRESGVRVVERRQLASTKAASWRILDLGGDAARCCHALFHFAAHESFKAARGAGILVKPVTLETFSLRMVTGSMVSSILKRALGKAISSAQMQQLRVKEERGSGYYIRGPSYCFSLLLQGDPAHILVGARAVPHNMISRAALRIRNPSLKTFRSFLPAITSFGVDLQANTLYIIKPLATIVRILEFVVGLNPTACTGMDVERRIVEVVEPIDPF